MSSTPGRYRVVNFIGGRILEARELLQMQEIIQGIDVVNGGTPTSSVEEQATYRQGAMLNATITVTGTNVAVSATNGSLPVQVFVRDRWESFLSGELTPVTLSGGQTSMYLNWAIEIVANTDVGSGLYDPTLVDGGGITGLGTGAPTAQMGQLNLQISATDTSTTPLNSATQLYKNLSPIPLCYFTFASGNYTLVPIDNVNPTAYASNTTSGLVKLTTGTASGVAVSTDDSRMSNARNPIAGSVEDVSVRTPVSPGGTNADGTTIYNLTSDPGGISAAKIVLTATTQLLSDAWTWLVTQFTSFTNNYNTTHINQMLGSAATHPMPTVGNLPGQINATPASHMNMNLNLANSHPATVSQSGGGGFALVRPVGGPAGAPMDAGFGITNGGVLAAGLNHDGDIYSQSASTEVATPGPIGNPLITYSGPLGLVSSIATVLAEHVNQTSGSTDPHGIVGLTSITSTASTDSIGTLGGATFSAEEFMSWTVFTFNFTIGSPVKIAIGSGVILHGHYIPLPAGSFSYTNFLATSSIGNCLGGGITVNNIRTLVGYDPSMVSNPGMVYCTSSNNTGTQPGLIAANIFAIAWITS
jgi:hypothetical protein